MEFTKRNQASINSNKVELDRELGRNCKQVLKGKAVLDSHQASAACKQAPKLIDKADKHFTPQDNSRATFQQPNPFTTNKANPKPAELTQQAAVFTARKPKAQLLNLVPLFTLPSKASNIAVHPQSPANSQNPSSKSKKA